MREERGTAAAADRWEWDGIPPYFLRRNGKLEAIVTVEDGDYGASINPDNKFSYRVIHIEGPFDDADAAVRQFVENAAKRGRWPVCDTCPDCNELTLTAKPRRLPAVDCTTPLPLKYISGPPFPSWLTEPDRPADEQGPAVSNVFLDPEEQRDAESDGLNFARGIAWGVLMTVVAGVLVGVWLACRS